MIQQLADWITYDLLGLDATSHLGRCARLLHLRHGEDPDATLYHQLVDGRGQRLFSH